MTAAPDARPLDPGGLLARVVRGPVVESVHLGHLVVLDPDGGVVLSVGDPDAVVLARSSLKPLQAVAMLRAGLDVDDDALALACASHSGEAAHLAVVRRVLADVGHDEGDLQNTPDLPLDGAASQAWRDAGHGPASVTQNCSGKHAAMIATCSAAGWDTSTYLAPQHPLQQAVRAGVEELTGVPADHVTVDGCGAPLLSTTLRGLAHGFTRVVGGAEGSAEARVARAMTGRPDLVGGTGRDVTAFLRAVPGMVAKDGAEAVYAAALRDGTAVALKIADGGPRARALVMAAGIEVALRSSGTADGDVVAAVRAVGRTPVLGHGAPVGAVLPAFGGDPAAWEVAP